MKRLSLAVAVLVCAGAQAAEPTATPATPSKRAASASQAPANTQPPAPAPAPPKRLDLRVGDIRNYMTPEEFRALITGREEERNTILVQADAPLLPMKSELDVPGGIIAPFWALANPHKAWRLLLPDPRVNILNIPPAEVKVPPPFRAGVPTF
jgi:hypothetical protein